MYEHCSLLSHILSPTASSVTTFMLSKAGDNEAGVVRMAVFGLLSLQIFVPRQFARVCHSVNMEWGVKENHVAVTALHYCGKSYSQIFELLKPLKISLMFIHWSIKHSEELWRIEDWAQSGCLKSMRA